MKKLLLLIPFILTVSCTPPPDGYSGKEDDLVYFQDCQTDLCFAWIRGGYHAAMSLVPCEKVDHILRNHCPVR